MHGNVARESVLPPRWALTGTPKHWYRSDVVIWAEARGYSIVSAVSQRVDVAWVFRGWPPAKADGAKVISFSSGIVLAPDAKGKSKAQKLVSTAKSSLGSREEKPQDVPKTGAKAEDIAATCRKIP